MQYHSQYNYWFAGIPLLEATIINLTFMVLESWKDTVGAIKA